MTWNAQADEVLVRCRIATLRKRHPVVDVFGLCGNTFICTALADRIAPKLCCSGVLPPCRVIEALACALVHIPARGVLPPAVTRWPVIAWQRRHDYSAPSMDSGIGLGELLILIALVTVALCVITGSVYATILGVRRLFNRRSSASRPDT